MTLDDNIFNGNGQSKSLFGTSGIGKTNGQHNGPKSGDAKSLALQEQKIEDSLSHEVRKILINIKEMAGKQSSLYNASWFKVILLLFLVLVFGYADGVLLRNNMEGNFHMNPGESLPFAFIAIGMSTVTCIFLQPSYLSNVISRDKRPYRFINWLKILTVSFCFLVLFGIGFYNDEITIKQERIDSSEIAIGQTSGLEDLLNDTANQVIAPNSTEERVDKASTIKRKAFFIALTICLFLILVFMELAFFNNAHIQWKRFRVKIDTKKLATLREKIELIRQHVLFVQEEKQKLEAIHREIHLVNNQSLSPQNLES